MDAAGPMDSAGYASFAKPAEGSVRLGNGNGKNPPATGQPYVFGEGW